MSKKALETIVQDNVQYFRNELGWSQEKLAEKAGLSKIYLAEIESHKRKPSIPMMEKLARALEIAPYLLMVEEPKAFVDGKVAHDELIDKIIGSINSLRL